MPGADKYRKVLMAQTAKRLTFLIGAWTPRRKQELGESAQNWVANRTDLSSVSRRGRGMRHGMGGPRDAVNTIQLAPDFKRAAGGEDFRRANGGEIVQMRHF